MEFELIESIAAVVFALGMQHTRFGSKDGDLPSDGGAPAGEALDRAKSRVLVNLLDDLRTPLMMIKAPLEAGSGIPSERVDTALEQAAQIQRGLERAIKIIQMDSEQHREERAAPTDLVDAVSYFVTSVRPRGARHAVHVGFDSDTRHAAVRMDWPRVELLLESVTDYALRGLREGGSLTYSVHRQGDDEVVLGIRSDGRFEPVDLSPDVLEHVGDPFTLALLLGRRTVSRHDGRLEFVQVGDEVSCQITLPAAEPPVESTVQGSDDQPETGERDDRQSSVLIVDDHAGTRAYLRFALRKHHRILEASDGREALEIVRAEKPDLVISDIMMPVMDGNELCRAVKADEELNHIPIFLVTANSIRALKTESLESGADDFLVKPFDVKEAVIRINNEIRMRRDLRSRYSRELVLKPKDITVTSEDEVFIHRARDIVEDNMANADFSIQELASEMGLSSRQLQRRLRETFEQSPVEFVRALRLKRAAQLLGGQYGNVSEVAYAVGFTSLSYFAKCFKEEFGTSPSSYREEHEG